MEKEQKERKGLWRQMMEQKPNVVVYGPSSWTLEKIAEELMEIHLKLYIEALDNEVKKLKDGRK